MNKKEYLAALEARLTEQCEDTRREIMDAFREHFAEGEARGLTEEEIIEELGPIEDLGAELERLSAEEEEPKAPGGREPQGSPAVCRKEKDDSIAAPRLVIDAAHSEAVVSLIPGRPGEELAWNLEEGIRFSSSLLKRLFMGREEGRVSFVPGEEEDLLRVEGGSGMLSVTVPVEVHALCVRLHSGYLSGAGLRLSSLDIHSSSGDIMLNDCSLEALNVESASGDVELEDILGEQRIGTASGDITLTGSRGCVEIGTASGDISVYDHGGGALQLHSSSGDMEAETQAALTAESASGDMELTVTDAAGYVTASSASGDISCYIKGGRYRAKLSTRSGDLLNHSGKQSSSGGRELHLGEGETLVELQTSSGDILLEEV